MVGVNRAIDIEVDKKMGFQNWIETVSIFFGSNYLPVK